MIICTFAPVMLGQASAIKARNQVSEYPPLSKLAGCFLCTPVLAAKIRTSSETSKHFASFSPYGAVRGRNGGGATI